MQTTTLPAETWDSEGPELLKPVPEDEDIDLDAEIEALYAEGLTFDVDRRSRPQRRQDEKSRTRYVTNWQGRRLSWGPTQTPAPVRIAAGRRRAKAARKARRANRG